MPKLALSGFTFYLLGPFKMDVVKQESRRLAPFASKTNIRAYIGECGGDCSNAMTSKVDVVLISDSKYYAEHKQSLVSLPEFEDYLAAIRTRGIIKRQDGTTDIEFLSIAWLIDSTDKQELIEQAPYRESTLPKARFDALRAFQKRIERDYGSSEASGTKITRTSYDGLIDGKYLHEDISNNPGEKEHGKRYFFNCVSGIRIQNHPSHDRGCVFGSLPTTDHAFTTTDALKIMLGDIDIELARWKKNRDYLNKIATQRKRLLWDQIVCDNAGDDAFELLL